MHRWSGLGLAVFVLIAGLTGALMAFENEIDAWLNADIWHVTPRERSLPLAQLVESVEAAHPQIRVWSLALDREPGETQRMMVELRDSASATVLPFSQLWVDPYSGSVLGTRTRGSWTLDRRHIMPLVHKIHSSLTLGRPGQLFMGGVSLLWLLTTLAGLYLAWPKRGRWKQAVSIKVSGGASRMLYDAHRAIGIVALLLIVIVTFTGFIMNLRPVSLPLIGLFSQMKGEPIDTMPDREIRSVGTPDLDAFIRRAALETRAAHPAWVKLDHEKGIVTVELDRVGERGPNREIHVYFDSHSGARLSSYDTAHRTGGEAFFRWQWVLHGLDYFGMPGRVAIALLGLLPIPLLAITGFVVWWRRRPASA